MGNSLIKKYLSFSFGSVISIIIGIITTPIITRLYSPEEFGKASMYDLIVNSVVLLVMLGLDQAYVRFFYEEEEKNRKFLLKKTLKPVILLTTTLLIIAILFSKKINLYIFNESNITLTVALLSSIFIMVLNRFATLVIRMQQKGKLFSYLEIISKVLNITVMLVMFRILGNNYKGIIYSTVITLLVLTLITIYFGKAEWKFFNKNIKIKSSTKEMLNFGLPLLGSSLISWLFQSVDRIAIKQWSDVTELGIYVAAFKIVVILNVIQSTFTTFWIPVAYEAYEKNSNNRDFFRKVNKIIWIMMSFVAVGTIMFKDIIGLLLGEEFRGATQIMPFLVLMPTMYTVSETTVLGINFKKNSKYHLLIVTISFLVNLMGNYLLVPKYGGKGAAIATGIAYLVFFITRTYFAEKSWKVGFELKGFYFVIILIMLYATYNTFYFSTLTNISFGFIIIMILLLSNYKFLKNIIHEKWRKD